MAGKSRLYTGTGDQGETSLVGGERISKTSVRLEAYGTCDEFSSFLGAILSDPDCPADIREELLRVQYKIFNVGGYLASVPAEGNTAESWGLLGDDIVLVEGWIDRLDSATPKLRSFVLPGGTPLAAKTHIARSVCRRAERRILALAQQEPVDPAVLKYFNRLSDWLFILARHFNHLAGQEEIVWKKE